MPEKLKPYAEGWAGLKTISQVISITEVDRRETGEVRYYLSSVSPGVTRFAQVTHMANEGSRTRCTGC